MKIGDNFFVRCSICCIMYSFFRYGCVGELITTGVLIGSAVAFGGFLGSFNYLKCRYYECCDQPWLLGNFSGLRYSLEGQLYGQHLVIETAVRSIKAHFQNENPKKALVLSFHGWTGGGKNYVASIIAQHLYAKGMKSNFVHLMVGTMHFAHKDDVEIYKKNLHQWIQGNVTQCPRSLFIIDELDKMPIGILDTIKPFIDFHEQLHGVDYRKSIFIFLSNTAGSDITQRTLDYWRAGKARDSISLTEMEELITVAAYNEEGGLRFSNLIMNHLIDQFIPFLPLERDHVRLCIADAFRSRIGRDPSETETNEILNSLNFSPKNFEIFSTSGCKRIAQKVEFFLQKRAFDEL